MIRLLPHRFLVLMLLLALVVPGALSAQTTANSRRARLRDHEKKIQSIIAERRIRQLEEQKKEAEKTVQENREGTEAVEEEANPEESDRRRRSVSTVVMGFKFLSEKGVSDYNIVTLEGETFLTEVYLFNSDQNPVESIRLALDFDKRFIEPIRIFDTTLRPYLKDEPDFSIDERDAIILYSAEFSRPLDIPEAILLRILWKANRPAPFTGIEFAFDPLERPDFPHTAIMCNGRNILGLADDPADGVLSGGLMIESPDEQKRVLQGKADELRDIYLGSVASESQVGLILAGPREPVHVGDDFLVHVVLNNPEGALIDALNFAVLFDPAVLEVVDRDQFNFIQRGVNVHDGPYHINFPWDMHKRNEVRPERGLVVYQKALSNGASLPSKPLATIQFRALAPATASAIGFVKGRPGAPDLTSIRYFGYERVDLGTEFSAANITVDVLPAVRQVAARESDVLDSPVAAPEEMGVRSLQLER